jgi:GTPase SAR1 family protein
MASSSSGGVVHKVIMVGSGGVGKSALTLQFMYDEVSVCFSLVTHNTAHSLSPLTNRPKQIRIGRRSHSTPKTAL